MRLREGDGSLERGTDDSHHQAIEATISTIAVAGVHSGSEMINPGVAMRGGGVAEEVDDDGVSGHQEVECDSGFGGVRD